MCERINSKAAFFILKDGAKYVSDGGKIITIVTALLGAFTGYYTTYAGSKAAADIVSRGVAKELQGRQVSVNAVAPGPMDTRELRCASKLRGSKRKLTCMTPFSVLLSPGISRSR